MNDDMINDIKAAVTGSIFSLLGINLIGVIGDALLAFIFGAMGALGGYWANRLAKKYEKKDDKHSKTS